MSSELETDVQTDLGPGDIADLLEEHDGKPVVLLQHNQAKYDLAEWKDNPVENNFAWNVILGEVNWHGVTMAKSDFEDSVDKIIAASDGDNDVGADDGSVDIPQLSAAEFQAEFDWNGMQDRKMAKLCHEWIVENENIIFSNDTVLLFDDGIWVPDEPRVARILQELLGGHYGNNVKEEYINGYVKAHDEYRVDWDDGMGLDPGMTAVENGLLDLKKGEIIRDLEPDDRAIVKLSTTWDGIDAECEEWENYLRTSVEANGRPVLQEYVGLCLDTGHYPHKKALMLLGGGDNGKGVFEGIVTKMLGNNNVSNDDLRDMGNQFGLQRLRTMAANINSDIHGGKIKETSMFKKLTGEDFVRVEGKHQTATQMKNPAKMIFAANSIPSVEDAQRAFYARWLLVQFPNRFTKNPDDGYMNADLSLEARIKENELSGVLAWAVKGYQRLNEQGHFTGTHTAEYNREQWTNYQDTTGTFIRNYIQQGNPVVDEGANGRMPVDQVFELYKKFISTTPTGEKSKRMLNNYITADFRYPDAETVVDSIPDGEGGKKAGRVWDGIYVPKEARDEISEQYKESL